MRVPNTDVSAADGIGSVATYCARSDDGFVATANVQDPLKGMRPTLSSNDLKETYSKKNYTMIYVENGFA
ncbi:hypothetical protein GWI33_017800 [Rhynchophorus ferrugineus]|uniref:Uncharacterized protein n=1 Tax=Rhynchophorus ferrugineus TaxID=354439 RepID=A0A834M7A0_RHYFE|nr:hypothetical protein GWI33_017800 [Rhynchophorus ferrugineus]